MNLRRGECRMCVCSNLYPPCIYSREPWGEPCRTALDIQRGGGTWLVEAVGPTGLLGRPGWSADGPGAPTAPNFLWWAILGCLVRTPLVLPCLAWSELSSWATLGPFELESVL